MGNPFCEDSAYLLVFDTKEIVPNCVVEAVSGAKMKGELIYRFSVGSLPGEQPQARHSRGQRHKNLQTCV